MLSKDVLSKIRLIEIETRRLLSGSFVGDYSSAKKGSGFEFDQIRDYQMGDDVRFIDWKSSARANKLLVKQYIEERNRTVVIAVDISASSFYAISDRFKIEVLNEIAAVLALVADYGKDKACLMMFSDHVEVFLPPASGRAHIHKIMEKLFTHKPKSQETNINCVFDMLSRIARKDSIVILLSDFISEISEKKLSIASRIYDLVAIRCLDAGEHSIPSVGLFSLEDIESGKSVLIDTRRSGEILINDFLQERAKKQEGIFKKFGIDLLDVTTQKPYVSDMIFFFRRRMIY